MTNPNLDTSQWYHMYLNDNKKSSFIGTNLYTNSGTIGAVFFNNTVDLSAPRQRWQIYPINSTTFVLRSGEGGANAFLGTHFVANEETEGHTRPCMVRGDVADDSVFWHFGSWGDGMFWLENAQNGSAYHVERKANGIMAMSPNVTAPQNLQRWGFEGIEKIDDEAWSSVNLLGATMTDPSTTSPPTSTSTSTPTTSASSTSTSTSTSSTPTPTPHTGLSTAAKAGIGAAVGLAAIIALVVLGLFYRRRRNARAKAKPHEIAYEPYHGQLGGGSAVTPAVNELGVQDGPFQKHELYHDSNATKYEMSGQTVVEVGGVQRLVELEAGGAKK